MTSTNQSNGSAAKANSRELERLQLMGAQFGMLQKSLKSLQHVRDELSKNPGWSDEHEARFEDLTTWILDRMQSASVSAAASKAQTLTDLRIKAKIWLEMHIPEDGDDVIGLASSICADVVALCPSGEVSSQNGHGSNNSERRENEKLFEAGLDAVRKSLHRMTTLDVPVQLDD